MPGLVVHAEDDNMVPVKESQLIHEAWFDSRLLRLQEGGHQRVLADPQVIEGVLSLLAGRRLQSRQSA
ncbi:putative aminoacrylate hydrolase RutD [compost metagenome]